MAIREVDPISRIEGHLGVEVDVNNGIITDARVHGNLFRGFENFLIGREANDPITYTQRICGVCPVPHGLTATFAADAALGYSKGYVTFKDDGTYGVPTAALQLRNLALACDMIMSSITHFYHLAAPSYIQGPAMPPWTPWFHNNYYNEKLRNPGGNRALPVVLDDVDGGFSADLWSAVITQYVKALRMRRLVFEASALFVGRAPMTSNFVAGGATNDLNDGKLAEKKTKFANIMKDVGEFIVKEYVPVALALSALYPAYDNTNNTGGLGYGAGLGQFLSWGSYALTNDTMLLAGGHYDATDGRRVWFEGKADLDEAIQLVKDNLTETIYHSRYANYVPEGATEGEFSTIGGLELSAYPGDVTRTQPDRDGNPNGYSYMKAPRWKGKAREVGPLARLVVAGLIQNDQPLAGTVAVDGLDGYTSYVKTNVSNVTGLDPAMIAPDIAVALVREGLATLTIGTDVVSSVAGMSKTEIEDAYTNGEAVITGTIKDHVIGLKGGWSTMDRIRARALESLVLVQAVAGKATDANGDVDFSGGWISELTAGQTYKTKPVPTGVTSGFGCVEAPRGSLAHFSTLKNGKITAYQCVVPYTWNGSPSDSASQYGPAEAAMINLPFANDGAEFTTVGNVTVPTAGGLEVLRVAQSFDPCIACAVH